MQYLLGRLDLDMVAHACDPSTQDGEEDWTAEFDTSSDTVILRPFWVTE